MTCSVSLEDLLVVSPDLVAPLLLCCGILTNTIVATALHVPNGGPPLLLFHLWVIVQNLVPKPGQVIYPQFVPFPCEMDRQAYMDTYTFILIKGPSAASRNTV